MFSHCVLFCKLDNFLIVAPSCWSKGLIGNKQKINSPLSNRFVFAFFRVIDSLQVLQFYNGRHIDALRILYDNAFYKQTSIIL